MDRSQLGEWLSAYGDAWVGLDPDAAASLFTEDAVYHETPYSDPFLGSDGVRDYWVKVTEGQSNVVFDSEVIGVADGTGVARWSARFDKEGIPVELDGVFLLEFDDQSRCRSLREWWHAR
jgi:hypothetical protein